jgi:hypothetical protein
MQPLTDKQKKGLWIIAGVLVFIHFFLPGIVNTVRHAFTPNAPAVVQKPSPAHAAPVPPPAPPPSPEVIAAAKYGGVWAGDELMPDQNRCGLRLEIRLSDDVPKKLKGYESKTCIPVQPLAGGTGARGKRIGDLIRDTSPVSAVMTGTPTEEGITFTVDSVIGTPYDGCSLTSMTITDFGQGQVQAQWQSQSLPQTPCPDNKMLLRKARG